MSPSKQSPFLLPDQTQVEIYLVKLPNGEVVTRTAAELAALPPDLRAQLVTLAPFAR